VKKILFVAFLLSFCVSGYAEDRYMVEKPDGSVSIILYISGEPLSEVIDSLGLTGYPIQAITSSDLPNTREDRDFWIVDDTPGKKIKIDSVKKQKKIDAVAAEDADIDAILSKLKISKEELKKLKKELK